MGINKLPSIDNYWSNDVLYKNNLVKKVMPKESYCFICFSLFFKEKNTSEKNYQIKLSQEKKYKFLLRNYLQIFKNIILWEKI